MIDVDDLANRIMREDRARLRENRGKLVVAYVGYKEFDAIKAHGQPYDLEYKPHKQTWHYMGAELIEVRKPNWFEIGYVNPRS